MSYFSPLGSDTWTIILFTMFTTSAAIYLFISFTALTLSYFHNFLNHFHTMLHRYFVSVIVLHYSLSIFMLLSYYILCCLIICEQANDTIMSLGK